MPSITVSLSEEQLKRLQTISLRLKLPPEEIARVGIEELLASPDNEFQQAMDYVLKKNAELYRRLA